MVSKKVPLSKDQREKERQKRSLNSGNNFCRKKNRDVMLKHILNHRRHQCSSLSLPRLFACLTALIHTHVVIYSLPKPAILRKYANNM